jgi:membrane-associated protein
MEEFFSQFWALLVTFIDPRNLVHPEVYVAALQTAGALEPSLVAVSAIVFAETGLLVGVLLPGDSMLVVVGIFIRVAPWPIVLFLVTLSIAAIVGDSVGYWLGKRWGPALFRRPDGRIFKQAHLQRAKAFYEKHGGKTIIIARFIPIIRTFVPAIAGAVKMNYRTFLFYNVIGGISWIVSMLMIGYMLDPLLKQVFGAEFEIAKHIDKVIIVVVLLSVSPMLWKWWSHRRAAKAGAPTTPATAPAAPPPPASPGAAPTDAARVAPEPAPTPPS